MISCNYRRNYNEGRVKIIKNKISDDEYIISMYEYIYTSILPEFDCFKKDSSVRAQQY